MSSKGNDLFEQAEKKLKSWDWFGAQKEQNNEAAAEIYVKAAAQYKQVKDFIRAGLCYEKAAECNLIAKNEIEANSNWKEAGKVYSKVDADKAIKAYNHAIQYYLDNDKFDQAARLEDEIGEIFSEEDKTDEAMKYYNLSAQHYESNNDETNANKKLEKMAMMALKLRKYEKAIPVFEKIAKHNADNNLLRWNVKNYLLKASVAVINENILDFEGRKWDKVSEKFEQYQNISDLFASAREATLIAQILESIKKFDVKQFKTVVNEFEKLTPLEPWMVEQLLIVEKYLEEAPFQQPNLEEHDEKQDDVNIDDGWEDDENHPKKEKEEPKVYDVDKANLENVPDLAD